MFQEHGKREQKFDSKLATEVKKMSKKECRYQMVGHTQHVPANRHLLL